MHGLLLKSYRVKEFTEALHPRGQPDNPGQFGHSPGGGAAERTIAQMSPAQKRGLLTRLLDKIKQKLGGSSEPAHVGEIAGPLKIKGTDVASSVLGKKLSGVEAANLAGADGGNVLITKTKWQGEHEGFSIRANNPTYHADRIAFKDRDGKLVMHNSLFELNEGVGKGGGVGKKVFGQQVDSLSSQGFDRIEATCAGYPGHPKMNGYITWAKFGYDGPIPPTVEPKLEGTPYAGAKTVQEVIGAPGGIDWWGKNGSAYLGTFDLKKGSTSMNRWAAYQAEKAKGAKSYSTKAFDESKIERVPEGESGGGQFTSGSGGGKGKLSKQEKWQQAHKERTEAGKQKMREMLAKKEAERQAASPEQSTVSVITQAKYPTGYSKEFREKVAAPVQARIKKAPRNPQAESDAIKIVNDFVAKRPSDSIPLDKLYEQVKANHPDLSIDSFLHGMLKQFEEGGVQIDPWTQPFSEKWGLTPQRMEFMIPAHAEYRFYVRAGRNASEKGAKSWQNHSEKKASNNLPNSTKRMSGYFAKSSKTNGGRNSKAFEESSHPRGQPENAGQFVEKGKEKSGEKKPGFLARMVNKVKEKFGGKKAAPKMVEQPLESSGTEIASDFMGTKLSDAEVAGMVGADGGKVAVKKKRWKGSEGISLIAKNDVFEAERIAFKDKEGKMVMYNDHIVVMGSGGGTGQKIFGSQVDSLIQKGFDRIEAECAGKANKPGEKLWYNGYITWAKFGYDGPIPPEAAAKLPGTPFEDCKTVQEIMMKEGGADWWEKEGSSFNGTFDLKEGSLSRRVWDAYKAKKSKGTKSWNQNKSSSRLNLTKKTNGYSPKCGVKSVKRMQYSIKTKDESGHEHAPAGSPKGGQFVAKGEGGGAGKVAGKEEASEKATAQPAPSAKGKPAEKQEPAKEEPKTPFEEWSERDEARNTQEASLDDADGILGASEVYEGVQAFRNAWKAFGDSAGQNANAPFDRASLAGNADKVKAAYGQWFDEIIGYVKDGGANEKELAALEKMKAKYAADFDKDIAKYLKHINDDAAQKALDELQDKEPEYPDEPEEPDEPEYWADEDEPDAPLDLDDEPDRDDYEDNPDGKNLFKEEHDDWKVAAAKYKEDMAAYKQAHAEWEKDQAEVDSKNDKLQSDYDKALKKWQDDHETWEKAHDKVDAQREKWEKQVEKLEEKVSAYDDEANELFGAIDDNQTDADSEIQDKVSAITEKIRERIDKARDADPEPEEEEEEEEEEEDGKSLRGYFTKAFEESKHPRGQPENAGQFAEKEGGGAGKVTGKESASKPEVAAEQKESKPAVDRSKPHFMGTKENPEAFLILPGKGKDGKDKEIYQGQTGYTEALIDIAEEHWNGVSTKYQESIGDLLDDMTSGADDADVIFDKADQQGADFNEAMSSAIDRLASRVTNTMKFNWRDNYDKHAANIGAKEDFDYAVNKAKEAIDEAVGGLTNVMDDAKAHFESGEEDESSKEYYDGQLAEAQQALDETLLNHFSYIKEAADLWHKGADESAEGEVAGWEEEADGYVQELGNYEDPADAKDDAAYYNEQLANDGNPNRVWFDESDGTWGFTDKDDLEDWPGKEAEGKKHFGYFTKAWDESKHKRVPKGQFTTKDFKESEHPRGGDKENPGRFSKAPGGGSGKIDSKAKTPALKPVSREKTKVEPIDPDATARTPHRPDAPIQATVAPEPQVQKLESSLSAINPSSREMRGKLKDGKVKSSKTLGGGLNSAILVTMDNGAQGVFKSQKGEAKNLRQGIASGTYYQREVAASAIANVLGMDDLVPQTVFFETKDGPGSSQEYREGVTAKKKMKPGKYATHTEEQEAPTEEYDLWDGGKDAARAAVFDYLIGHQDRHPGNWLIQGETGGKDKRGFFQRMMSKKQSKDKLALIDNGLALPSEYHETDFNCVGGIASVMHMSKGEMKMPDIKGWRDKWPKIEQVLKESGIDDKAIALTKQRFTSLISAETGGDMRNLPVLQPGQPGYIKTVGQQGDALAATYGQKKPEKPKGYVDNWEELVKDEGKKQEFGNYDTRLTLYNLVHQFGKKLWS